MILKEELQLTPEEEEKLVNELTNVCLRRFSDPPDIKSQISKMLLFDFSNINEMTIHYKQVFSKQHIIQYLNRIREIA